MLAGSFLPVVLAALVVPVAPSAAANADPLIRRDPIATEGEIAAAATWAHRHVLGPASEAAFSFIVDGHPSREILARWERTQAVRELDPGREEHAIAYRDAKTGLVCTCVAIVYRNCPAIDWLLRFENMGTADTPVIERIEPLDVTLMRPAPCTITLHHSLGDSNSKDSFRPLEDVLTPAA